MIKETLKEFIADEYSFMDCNEGCWKSGNKVTAINTMDKSHIENCIKMVERWHIDLTNNQYKDQIEKMVEEKLSELNEAIS